MTNQPIRVIDSHANKNFKTGIVRERIRLPQYVVDSGGTTVYYTVKRVVDIAISILALLCLAPFLLLIALLIQINSAGPVFFRQKRIASRRVQRNGKMIWETYPFTMYKFRTMRDDASSDIHRQFVKAFIHNDISGMKAIKSEIGDEIADTNGSENNPYKLHSDPRVTSIGKFLRKTSLDELPQLINVIRGEMSLVGPRPALPYEVKEYEDWHNQRFAAYQGITGYWQIVGRSEVSFDKMVELDIWYAKHQSLLLDFKIILLTPFKVLKGKGAE
jgi:lipopolysaccharide/colanic/teichoic acid biosynthesis glycosyltransferase